MRSSNIAAASVALLTMSALCDVCHATPVTSDTSAFVGLSDCSDPACVTGKQPRYSYQVAGNPGDFAASATDANAATVFNFGAASATLGTVGVAGAPTLRATASSTGGERNLAAAFALQSYTWDGTGAATRTFGGTLTYFQSLVPGSYGNLGNGVISDITVFESLPGAAIDAGTTADDNSNFLMNFDPTVFGWTTVASTSFSDATTTLNGMSQLSTNVTLQTGVDYWIYVDLYAIGTNGGAVDASHTLVTNWSDTTGLTPATAVPEPTTLSLLGLGLAGVAFLRRKRQS